MTGTFQRNFEEIFQNSNVILCNTFKRLLLHIPVQADDQIYNANKWFIISNTTRTTNWSLLSAPTWVLPNLPTLEIITTTPSDYDS